LASLSKGTSFTDGVTGDVTAAKLHALVDAATPVGGLISDRTAKTSVAIADTLLLGDSADSGNLKKITVSNLVGTLPAASITTGTILTATLGTTTGTNAIFTSGTLTTGVIPTATLGTTTGTAATFTSGTIPTLTAGTTTSTAANITNGTVQTLTASTGSITVGTVGTLTSTTGNIATGTIGNLTTTLAGDVTISTGTATVGTRVAVVNTAQEYTRTHNFDATTLTSATSIAWDLSQNQVARLSLATNGTMADPSNKVDGATYILSVTQSTGTNTLAWNANFKWPGGTAPTLTAGSGKTDIFTFVSNGTSLFGVASQNYS
jgi:hypothetical protein